MNITLDKNKIVLGISGGVDSTTAALLLLEKGYEVYGMYFNIHDSGEEGRKAALRALIEAYKASNVEISNFEVESKYFIYRDVNKIFNDIIVSDFCTEYLSGRTPNPCVVCNPAIKFRLLKEAADEAGAYHFATGHYADVYSEEASGISYIKASTSRKDQSYMLYRLPQEIVSRVMFPLASFENKDEIRAIAEQMGMSNAKQSDSQEICFVPDGVNYADYISEWVENSCRFNETAFEAGDFVDKDGNVLGRHKGIVNYTIGQRKGLGIALGKPAFVTEINASDNTVVLGDNEELFKHNVIIDDVFFTETNGSRVPEGIEERVLTAKVRYAAPRAAAHVRICGDDVCGTAISDFAVPGSESAHDTSCDAGVACRKMLEVVFEVPQRAMTPGQSLVIYDGDLVIGGGRIIKTY